MTNQLNSDNSMPSRESTAPVLVTGATGHTGRRLVEALLQRGFSVRILTRDPARMALPVRRQVEVVRGDITHPETVQRATAGARAVLAATHIKFAHHIIDAMQQAGIRRGIFMSSTRRFTRFVEDTARQVMAGEAVVEESGLDWTIIRPTMIYGGKKDNNLQPLLQQLRALPVFPLPGGGKMLWQPVFTWDVVDAMIAALERQQSVGKAYTIAGPEAISYRDMLATMIREAGLKTLLVPVPLAPLGPMVRFYESVSKQPKVRHDQILRLQENKDFDISEARRDLGFDPISFEEGIRRKVNGDV